MVNSSMALNHLILCTFLLLCFEGNLSFVPYTLAWCLFMVAYDIYMHLFILFDIVGHLFCLLALHILYYADNKIYRISCNCHPSIHKLMHLLENSAQSNAILSDWHKHIMMSHIPIFCRTVIIPSSTWICATLHHDVKS